MTEPAPAGASQSSSGLTITSMIAMGAAFALAGFSLYTALFGVMSDMIQRSVHLGLVFVLVFLGTSPKAGLSIVQKGLSLVLAVIGVAVMAYHVVYFDEIAARFGELTPLEFYLGIAATLVLLEATRRSIGLPIVILAVIFLLYAYYGGALPGIAGHRGYDAERIISQLYLGGSGIFGTPLGVSATFVILIVLFGAILEHSGAGPPRERPVRALAMSIRT